MENRTSYGRNFEGIPVDVQGYIYPENSGYSSARRYIGITPVSLGKEAYWEEIDAKNLAGIHIDEDEQLDPNRFWSQHTITDQETGEQRHTVKADFLELASKIPAVYDALEKGRSLDELCDDPELGSTATLYFSEQEVLRVKADGNGYFELGAGGRHRALAARELNMKIPAKVISIYQEQKQGLAYGDSNSLYHEYGLFW